MAGLILRLAGPMQAWGDHSTFSVRDTRPYPTRSGLTGLIAAALGRRRGEPIDDLAGLRFTVRVDRPGTPMEDYHTVGGGLPPRRTVMTAKGKRREPGRTTIVSRRHYLADAVFTVAVTGPEATVGRVAEALAAPTWAPYLGRRSCPADAPLLLRWPVADPVAELYQRVPLARQPVARRSVRSDGGTAVDGAGEDTVEVEFVHEAPPDTAGGASDTGHSGDAGEAEGGDTGATAPAARLTHNDVPLDFHPHQRRYLSRTLFVRRAKLPARLCAGRGGDYLEQLRRYLEGSSS